MSAKKKYDTHSTLEDVEALLQIWRAEHGLGVRVVMPTLGAGARIACVEVSLYDLLETDRPEAYKYFLTVRGAVDLRGERQWSQLLLTLNQAWSRYIDDPWQWTRKDRWAASQVD